MNSLPTDLDFFLKFSAIINRNSTNNSYDVQQKQKSFEK